MITKNEIEDLIYNTVDIVPPGEDSVFLGVFSLVDNAEMLSTVLVQITGYYDRLLATLPLTPVLRLQVQMQRCFTYDEYKVLFMPSVRDFSRPIFKTLLITTQAERLLFITNPNRDDSFHSFLAFMQQWCEIYNPLIYTLLYGIHN